MPISRARRRSRAARERIPVIGRLALVALLVLAPTPVLGQVACGDTIGAGEKVVLTADVGPCTASTSDPALHVVGSATLDLAGHHVRCDPNDPPTGILVDGKGAKILRGAADECDDGIRLAGEGKHTVEDFVATRNRRGVQIDSDKNKLKRVAAVESDDNGVHVEGNANKIDDTESVGNEEDGFRINGDGNTLKRIASSGNGGDAIRADGDGNKIKDCRATASAEDGVELKGNGNKVEKCLAATNAGAGFDIDGSSTQVKKNLAFANDAGISVGDDGPNAGNVLKQNVALGNADLDLQDANAGCGTNQWQKNRFGTSDAAGTPNPACIQ